MFDVMKPAHDDTPQRGTHRLPEIVNHSVPRGLLPFVERAVTVDYSDAVGAGWLVIPSGSFGLRAILSDSYAPHDGLGSVDTSLIASGVFTKAIQASCRRPNAVLAVALTPLGAAILPLSTSQLDSFADVAATEVVGRPRAVQLRQRLSGATSLSIKADAYFAWLEDMFQSLRPAYGRRLALAEAADQMRQGRVLSIEDAARRVGVSRRQFERDFRHHLGVSPKQYEQVATFQRFAQLAWRGDALALIAAELEMTDQSHLTRSVKALTGLTPAALLTQASHSALSRLTRPQWGGRITYI